mmetsp:Transcript_24609/g.68494  ORF Transcript_24609/g.68494 Transcript_24609/m.68494 type:complete len:231 (+) Transcript_24609:971-1663(+)
MPPPSPLPPMWLPAQLHCRRRSRGGCARGSCEAEELPCGSSSCRPSNTELQARRKAGGTAEECADRTAATGSKGHPIRGRTGKAPSCRRRCPRAHGRAAPAVAESPPGVAGCQQRDLQGLPCRNGRGGGLHHPRHLAAAARGSGGALSNSRSRGVCAEGDGTPGCSAGAQSIPLPSPSCVGRPLHPRRTPNEGPCQSLPCYRCLHSTSHGLCMAQLGRVVRQCRLRSCRH